MKTIIYDESSAGFLDCPKYCTKCGKEFVEKKRKVVSYCANSGIPRHRIEYVCPNRHQRLIVWE